MRRSLHTLAANLHLIIKSQQPAPLWSLARLGLPHASTNAPFSSAGDGREGSNKRSRIHPPCKDPKSQLAALPSRQEHALSQLSPQVLQRMLSGFPAQLTPAHVHSVLAWAIDHYEQQGAARVWKARAPTGHAPSFMPQTADMPSREGRGAQGNGNDQLQHKEHGLMEDILRDLVFKLDRFRQWDQHLLQACNRLATHPAAPPRVHAHASTLTAAGVRQVLIDRSWGHRQVQAMATLVSNSLATLSHDSEPQRHAATLRDALDALPSLIPPMNIVPSWRTALALSQLGLPHIPTFEAIAYRFKYHGHLDHFSPKELALLGQAFACVGARCKGLFDLMSLVLERKLNQMRGKDISMLTCALHRLDLKSSPLLGTLASAVNHLVSTATAAVPQPSLMAPPPPPPLSQDSFECHRYGHAGSSESPIHPIPLAASAQPLNPTLSNSSTFPHMERLEHTPGAHPWSHGVVRAEKAQGRMQHPPYLSNLAGTTQERTRLPISPTNLSLTAGQCLKLRSGHARPLAAALCNVGAAAMAGNLQMAPNEADETPRHQPSAQDQGAEFTQGGKALHVWPRRETQGGEGGQREGLAVDASKLGSRGAGGGIFEPRLIVLLLSTAVFYRVHNPELLARGLQALQHCPPQQIEQQLQLPQVVHLLWVLAKTSTNSSSPAAPHSMQSKVHSKTEGFEQLYTQGAGAPPLTGDLLCRDHSPVGLSFSHAGLPVGSEEHHGWRGHSRGAVGGGTHPRHPHAQLLQVLLERLRTTHGQLSPLLACVAVQALAALGFRDHSLVSLLINSVTGASPAAPHLPASFLKGLGHCESTELDGCKTSSRSSSSSSNSSSSNPTNSDTDRSSSSSTSSSGSNLEYAKSALSSSTSTSRSSSTSTRYTMSNRSHGGSREDLTPSTAIRTLCALAELHHRDQGVVGWLTHHALKGTPGRPHLKPPQLPYLTWALAKLHLMEPGAWQSLVANIASSTHAPNACQMWQPQQLTQVMWALGEAYPGDGLTHVPGWDRAVRGVLQAVEDQLPRFTSRQLLLVMHGVARVRCSLPALPVVDHIALQASRCVARRAYSLDDLLVLLWSSVVAGHASHMLYDAIAEALLPAVDDLQLGGATLAAWCYLRHANYLHPTLTERLLHHCTVLLERGNKQASDPGTWGGNMRLGGGNDGPPHTEHPNLGQHGSMDCSSYGPSHHQHQQGRLSFGSFPKKQQKQQQQQHHRHSQDQQQAMQQAPQALGPPAEQCSAVLLLTLAASFTRCQSNFSGVGALFACVAVRAAHMQQRGPLDTAEHEALTHLMALLGHPHAATSAYPCLPLPLLSNTGCNTTADNGNGSGEQTAYPALPLSLQLSPPLRTPAFEEGGTGWMEWGGGGGVSSWGQTRRGGCTFRCFKRSCGCDSPLIDFHKLSLSQSQRALSLAYSSCRCCPASASASNTRSRPACPA